MSNHESPADFSQRIGLNPITVESIRAEFKAPKARRRLPVKTIIGTSAAIGGIIIGTAFGSIAAANVADTCASALGDAESMITLQNRALTKGATEKIATDLEIAAKNYQINAATCRASN